MRKFSDNSNVDNSDLVSFPDARIKDNTGSNDGTAVNERVYGDIIQFFLKLKRDAGITENNLPDNEIFGFQIIDSLMAFANKNNYIQNINSVSGVLNVSVKIGLMKNNESLICKSSVDLGVETQIKGIDGVTYSLTTIGNFKTDEFIRLIKTGSSIILVRLVDLVNLDLAVSEALYLKKGTQAEENAGTIETVATTPLTNKTVFGRRVNGADSGNYLAKPTGDPDERDGLLSKADKLKIDNIGDPKVRNIGTTAGIDINDGTIGTTYAVTGDIVSATLTAKPMEASVIRIVLSNTMTDVNYYVRMYIESLATNINLDNAVGSPVFKVINATTFDISIQQFQTQNQNLKIHFEVVKI